MTKLTLPATDAQAMANQKVQALVEAANAALDWDNAPDLWAGDLQDALAALEAPMRCAECDCKNGGADCNWIATT